MQTIASSEQIMERVVNKTLDDGLRVLVFLMKRAYLVLHNRTLVKRRNELLGALVLGHLCESSTVPMDPCAIPTNDYDDVVNSRRSNKVYLLLLCTTKKATESTTKERADSGNRSCTIRELTTSVDAVQTSSGLAPHQMTSVPNSTDIETLSSFYSPGRSRSALVKTPNLLVSFPTNKQSIPIGYNV
ncbi:hypothetical protein Tco_0707355 [Tanacetum coccineum]|uniref:Uncharacterized protein n=1 Tax=Tanacetum coccineum TaxID=301880 RepID=A0ABQ4YA10_9ASTR